MANLNRLRVAWAGTGPVGPGLSTFYFTGTMAGVPAAVVTFFTALAGSVPTGLTWDIPSSGDTLEDSTGELTGGWSVAGGAVVNGSGGNNFAAGVGCRIVWQTGNVFLGRRVRGSTFVVPLLAALYDTPGTINNATITTINTACSNFVAAVSPDFKVYSRPRPGGAYAVTQVTSGAVPDKVSTLRSRRV